MYTNKHLIIKFKKTLQHCGKLNKGFKIFNKVCILLYEITKQDPNLIITRAILNGMPTLLLRKDKNKKIQQQEKHIVPLFIRNDTTRAMYSISWFIQGAHLRPEKVHFSIKLTQEILLAYYKASNSFVINEKMQMHKSALYYYSILKKIKRVIKKKDVR